ncbi:hypothetical protein WA026_019376 [Henosepilachna vigintioctopunctata]
MEFIFGGASSAIAGFITNPLEVIKTRMQIQGELKKRGTHAVYFTNFTQAAVVITKHEGILALQKGLVPTLLFQFTFNGCRLGAYQLLQQNGYTSDANGNISFYKNLVASGLCGAVAIYFNNPLTLIKTHLQTEASKQISLGHQHKHSGTWSAFRTIYKNEGVRGLYRGSHAAVICAIVGSTSQLMSFTYVKQYMNEAKIFQNNPLAAVFTASMIGGVVLCLAMTPFDLILTRLYNQGVDPSGRNMLYRNFSDCVVKIWKSEGFLGFYKGIGPSYIRLGPHTVLSLVIWDKLQDVYTQFEIRRHHYMDLA